MIYIDSILKYLMCFYLTSGFPSVFLLFMQITFVCLFFIWQFTNMLVALCVCTVHF